MDYRVQEPHARRVYTTQDISRMGTARAKHGEEADTRIVAKNLENPEKN